MPAAKPVKGAVKPKVNTITVDVSAAAEQKVVDPADYEKFLREHIKVDKKTNNLGDKVKVERKGSKISVTVNGEKITAGEKRIVAKRYVKYLTKRYLKKQDVRDYLRVVAKDKASYSVQFFKVSSEEEEEE